MTLVMKTAVVAEVVAQDNSEVPPRRLRHVLANMYRSLVGDVSVCFNQARNTIRSGGIPPKWIACAGADMTSSVVTICYATRRTSTRCGRAIARRVAGCCFVATGGFSVISQPGDSWPQL